MKFQHKIEQRETQVRQIHKELGDLYEAKRNMSKLKLPKPLRYGWYKHLRLRGDIERRVDAATFQEIIEVCGSWVWGREKKRVNQNWIERTKKDRDWQFPGFKKLSKEDFEKLSIKAQRHFVEHEKYWSAWTGSVKVYYCTVPRFYFVTTYSRAYVYEKQLVDANIESRIDELENNLLDNKLYGIAYRSRGYWPRKYYKNQYNRKTRRMKKINWSNFDEHDYEVRLYKAIDAWL